MLYLLALTGLSLAVLMLLFTLLRPDDFILFYLLAFTHFFGLVNFDAVEIEGLFKVMPYLNVLCIGATLVRIVLSLELRGRGWGLVGVVCLLFLYGLFRPFVFNESTIKHALMDGKDFLSYGFLAYLLAHGAYIDVEKLIDRVIYIALGLSLVELAAVFGGVAVPGYEMSRSHVGLSAGLRVISPTLVALGWFFLCHKFKTKRARLRDLGFMAVVFSGLLFQEHRSIILGTAAASAMFYFHRSSLEQKLLAMVLGVFLATALLFGLGADKIHRTFVSPIVELIEGSGAIEARDNINRLRWDLISERPVTGYGFIDEKSERGRALFRIGVSAYEQSFGTVDSGYVDLIIRFGYAGAALFLLPWAWAALGPFIPGRGRDSLGECGAFFLWAYFPVNITWSVFSYGFGIVPGIIAFFLTMRAGTRPPETGDKAPKA